MSISGKVDPVVRPVTAVDIAEALVEGLRDFQALPLYGLCFGGVYAAGGIAIMLCLTSLGHGLSGLSAGGGLRADRTVRGDRPLRSQPPPRARRAGLFWRDLDHSALARRDRLDGLRHAVRVRGLDVPGAAADRAAARPERLVLELPGVHDGGADHQRGPVVPRHRQRGWRGAVADFVFADRGVVSAAARPRGRFRHRDGDERARGGDEPAADDLLGRA